MNDIAVIGAGGWGTALAVLLAGKGNTVRLWGYEAAQVAELAATRRNDLFLPGITIPEGVLPSHDLAAVVKGCRTIAVVVPSRGMRGVLAMLREAVPARDAVIVSCTKGIEHGSGKRMSEILAEHLPDHPLAVLSGPSHAEEVARGTPTAVVSGSADPDAAASVQDTFSTATFRVYTSSDMAGIELGGALKNVYALAAGVSDGLGLGDNTKAALVTRALAELIRLGTALGGRRETFQGLSGIGDLMVTCFSRHSRNRSFGERLGRGESPEAITSGMAMVAEGVPTARGALECARKFGIVTPILDQVHAILHDGRRPADAMRELLTRDLRPEQDATGEDVCR